MPDTNNISLAATGDDTDIGVTLTAKGTGGIVLEPGSDSVKMGVASTAEGDIYYVGSSLELVRLGKGTAGQQLVMNATPDAPEWVDPGFGGSQVWSNPAKTFSTEYENTTGRPIQVSITGVFGGSTRTMIAYVNSSSPATSGASIGRLTGADTNFSISFIVPAGHFYEVNLANSTLKEWAELS